ncbi:MAG: sodium:solute symporter family protein [Gammaproteobacteria bacterium]|nr:sodium:solute symporter family protein [Gammaproteobacteria bacterium]
MSVVQFTFAILVVYLIALKTVSIWAYRRSVASSEDYFLARRNVTFFALIATTAASIFSTGTVISAPSEFFTKGSNYFWIFFFMFVPLAMMPVALKIWRIGKFKKFVTPGDLLSDFYQCHRTKIVTAIIGLLALIPYSTAQMVAIGKTFEALTNGAVSYDMGVTIVCAAIGLYLYFGGSRAVIWTDMVQGVIFMTLLLITGILAAQWAGGWQLMNATLLNDYPDKATFSFNFHYFEYIPITASFFLLPHVWQRIYMAKTANALAKNIMILPFVFLFLFSATWVIGTAGYSMFPNGLADGDNLMGAMFAQQAPYFGAFVLVAAFAAGMSTTDSQLLSAGAIFTHDFRPSTPVRNDKKDFMIARFSTLSLLAFIYVWSLFLQSQSVFGLIILGVSLTVIFIPAVFGMFFWRRASSAAAFWSLTSGLIIFLVHHFTALSEYFPGKLGASGWGLIVATLVFVVVSFIGGGKALDKKRAEYAKLLAV